MANEVKVPCGGFKLGGGLSVDPYTHRLMVFTPNVLSSWSFYWQLSKDKKYQVFYGADPNTQEPIKIEVPIDWNAEDYEEKAQQVSIVCDKWCINSGYLPLKFYSSNHYTLQATGNFDNDWATIERFNKTGGGALLEYIHVWVDSAGLHEEEIGLNS